MKKILYVLSAALLLASATASGQIARTSYFMEGSPQRMAFNPAFRPYRGYIQIPALGNLNVGYASNAFSVDKIIYPVDGTNVLIFNEAIKWSDIEGFLRPSNNLDLEVSLPIISFGFFTGRGFWSFDTKMKTETGFSLPKDFFAFMKGADGNGPQQYDLKGTSVGANVKLQASLGYSHRLFENLTVGARVNVIGGVVNVHARYDKLDLAFDHDIWSVSAAGTATIAGAGLSIRQKIDPDSGRMIIDFGGDEEENYDEEKDPMFRYNYKGLSGFGLTFDLGAEYVLLDNIKLSLSLLDVGFMRWNAGALTSATSEANYTWADETHGDFKDFTRFYVDEQSSDLKTRVYASFIVGAEYDIFSNRMLRVGAMYMNKGNEFVKRSEFSFALTTTPVSWFTASVNYVARNYHTISDSAVGTLGFALNFHASWINFFVGTDYLISKFNPQFIPVSNKLLNLYMGLSIPLAREKPRHLPKLGI